ncbi:MAG: hypothetical protein V1909_04865 [Candidatus Micrarchaeota archaeon]
MLLVRGRSVPKSSERIVALKTKASIPLIANILSNTKAQEIRCSKAIYDTIPKRALLALDKMNVKVRIISLLRGRPNKHPLKVRSQVFKLLKSKFPKKEISEKLGIPLRTVYWLEKKG